MRGAGRVDWRSSTALASGGVAALLGLCGPALPARAQAGSAPATPQAEAAGPTAEVVVTANRREQKLESVPYSISVVSGQQLAQEGVTDLQSLEQTVPGVSTYDYGARAAGATTPIIRGINATSEPTRAFRTFEQSPVGLYVGNSPIDGYIQLDDLKQVEVLRGPQGTLYGAGSLSGALRLIPNSPELGQLHGSLEASGGGVSHSGEPSYAFDGVLNVPLGETLAVRASTKYAYDPGFITVHGLLQRQGLGVSGVPVLADPADPVNSSGLYSSQSDWDYQKSLTSRVSLLWKPTARLRFEAGYIEAGVEGDGGPVVNRDFPGGASPFDPKEVLPAGGPYQEFSQVDQPFSRHTHLISLDASYDAGFATLSTTSSYYGTEGSTLEDNTYDLAGIDGGAYTAYYAGVPANPRFVYDEVFTDRQHTFSQEVRLVSKAGPQNLFDYTVGAFYEDQTSQGDWTIAVPGSPERSVAQGCTAQAYTGAPFPACLVIAGAGDVNFQQIDTQHFRDTSEFGELTVHYLSHGQITLGVRHFSQSFTDAQSYQDFTFPTYIPATPHDAPTSKTVGKVDVSYEYLPRQTAYALWSQGFRRGGANSVPLVGIFQESALLSEYKPDTTNNYEAGFKGRLANGMTYTVDGFYIAWDKPQISASLPSGNLAVYNADTAASKGFELESAGPLPLPVEGFSYDVSLAYADATLTRDFTLPAKNGHGVITPGLISGKSGQQLPGSPKFSAGVNLQYQRWLIPDYRLTVSVNGTYRSAVDLNLTSDLGTSAIQKSSDYGEMNMLISVDHKPWRASLYATNLLDTENILATPFQPNELNNLTNDYIVSRPREVGVRLAYSF